MRPARAVLIALAVAASARGAAADSIDQIGRKLVNYDAEIKKIGSGLQRPAALGLQGGDYVERRLIDAQVAFGMGSYDEAALLLFDIVEKHKDNRSWDTAVYFLAESLFQRADFAGSRTYFIKLVDEVGAKSTYYQQSLERLIELSIKLQDSTGVTQFIAALEAIPDAQKRPSVPYVRGKYAYFSGDYDGAIEAFGQVKPGNEYTFQARYFAGAAQLAKGDLGAAAATFTQLTREQPGNDNERRISEMAHLALGRVYYERDQPGKAIDQYLTISRKSDLFDEALYEVAWVYVKDKQFEKALRALELLALTDPRSSKLPDVRILEGNLRIRKAREVAAEDTTSAEEEYTKALDLFETTRDAYVKPREELERIIAEHDDPVRFLDQITGQAGPALDVQPQLPEVAASWLREEPDVQRVVAVETDLGGINKDIVWSLDVLDRIERAIDSPSRVNIFPSLAEKQARATEILEDLFKMRGDLANTERGLVMKYATPEEKAEFDRLQGRRHAIASELASLPHADVAYSERLKKAKEDYDLLDQRAKEVEIILDATEAEVVAIEKYLSDITTQDGPPKDLEDYQKKLAEDHAEINAMRTELEAIRREQTLGKDAAGLADDPARRGNELRGELRQALDDEHQFMMAMVDRMNPGDRTKAEQISSLTGKAATIAAAVNKVQLTVNQIVDSALVDVRAAVAEEKANLTSYQAEYTSTAGESRTLGGEVVGLSFATVSKKFYDVLVRADVGVIDVAWASKEQAESDLKKVRLDEAHEQRMIQDEYRDVLEPPKPKEGTGTGAPATQPSEPVAPGTTPPAGTAAPGTATTPPAPGAAAPAGGEGEAGGDEGGDQ